jgi:hypothetical protein
VALNPAPLLFVIVEIDEAVEQLGLLAYLPEVIPKGQGAGAVGLGAGTVPYRNAVGAQHPLFAGHDSVAVWMLDLRFSKRRL